MENTSRLVPEYSLCKIYCEHTSDKQMQEILIKFDKDEINETEYKLMMDKYSELNSEWSKFFNEVCAEIDLTYDDCLVVSNDKFVRNVQMLFTYLSINSTIIMTNYLNSHIDLLGLQEAIITYLLTGEDSQLPFYRYSVANLVKSYLKPSIFQKIFRSRK